LRSVGSGQLARLGDAGERPGSWSELSGGRTRPGADNLAPEPLADGIAAGQSQTGIRLGLPDVLHHPTTAAEH
jgi:hypothetical protein